MKERILVISSANIDLSVKAKRFPAAGETLISDGDYAYLPGGKGANASRALAALGADTVFLCRFGDDSNGRRLRTLYEREGIDTRFIVTDCDEKTGFALVLCEEGAENRIIVYPGANAYLSASDVEEAFTSYPDGVFVQMEIPDEALLAAGRFASESSVKLIVDAGPARPDFPFDRLGRISIFSPNEAECEAYTGIYPTDSESCLRACVALGRMMKADNIVLKLGERGAFAYDGKFYRIVPSFRVKAVDTTGAGDVFTSALALRTLAHVASAHHSSGDADGLALHLVEIVLYVLRVCVKVESDLLEGIASCGDESGKLVPANLKDFGKRRLGRGVFNVFVHDKISPFLRRGRQK